jgi:stage II sporulation protein AA (anti-sigma F factor antagonist)
MQYTVKGDTATFYLAGELDHAASAQVRDALDQVITENRGVRHLVLDMNRLSFMDSSGIGVILGRYKRVAQRGGDVAVRNTAPAVDRILSMSGIYTIIRKA